MNRSMKRLCLLVSLLTVPVWAAAGADAPAKAAAKLPKAVPLSGKVLETMESGGYSYVLMKTSNDKVWVAFPHLKVSVGQQLSLVPGYEMKNFTSKGLNRKFDRLIFSAGVANQQYQLPPAAIKMAHQGLAKQQAKDAETIKAAHSKPRATAGVKVGRIAKAKGAHCYSVAELYARKAKLEKKQVTVRGKVVKVSTHILKRNWVHIQDGTGAAGKKNNDLVVTTHEIPKEGDVVTVRGTLYSNMDFGSGYRYEVLVEASRIN